ncbi:hypothetical protein ACJQWK_09079 [Exserohilum turcicum]
MRGSGRLSIREACITQADSVGSVDRLPSGLRRPCTPCHTTRRYLETALVRTSRAWCASHKRVMFPTLLEGGLGTKAAEPPLASALPLQIACVKWLPPQAVKERTAGFKFGVRQALIA